ncbi:hypothetical protein [Actinomadura sp. WAC 06369]|uniref:hypothetical protein n=1 Tax=Actinomadura sp. WAC 06369 TaxID=2203193 RepID=UPI000F798A45|nr:hypothetical protein [Actinomadura sp. WAC 06369]
MDEFDDVSECDGCGTPAEELDGELLCVGCADALSDAIKHYLESARRPVPFAELLASLHQHWSALPDLRGTLATWLADAVEEGGIAEAGRGYRLVGTPDR